MKRENKLYKKILFLSRVMPAHGIGGMQQHAENISKFLKKNFQITVLTTRHPDNKNQENEKNLNIIYLKNTKPGKYYGGWWKESGKEMARLLKNEKYDIILSESVSAYSFFKCKNNIDRSIPVITFCHGTFPKEINTTLKKKWNFKLPVSILYKLYNDLFIDRYFYPRLFGTISTSKEIHSYFSKKYPENKSFIVYNGIDTVKYAPAEKDEVLLNKYGLNSSEIILLSVGRLEKEKGVDDILEIFPSIQEKYSNLKFIWVGGGTYEKRVRGKINKMGLERSVLLLEKMDQDRLSKIYNIADVFVFPSRCDEGLPLVVLEALSSGLPVISSKSHGIEEIIEDGKDGFLFPAGNHSALKEKIFQMIMSSERLIEMKKNARIKAKNKFSIEKMGEQVIRIILKFV